MSYRTPERRAKSRTINSLVGGNIREHRLRLGMTQSDCSSLLAGAHESYWRSIESGQKDMSMLRVVEVAEVLSVDVSELLVGV